jgi:hypothetical protein
VHPLIAASSIQQQVKHCALIAWRGDAFLLKTRWNSATLLGASFDTEHISLSRLGLLNSSGRMVWTFFITHRPS